MVLNVGGIFLACCGAMGLVFVGGVALVVFIMVRAGAQNQARHDESLDDELADWLAAEGYELLNWKTPERGRDHPFRKGGITFGSYGGQVVRLRAKDRAGDVRDGWLRVPFKTKPGLYVGRPGVRLQRDWDNAEVIWDGRVVREN